MRPCRGGYRFAVGALALLASMAAGAEDAPLFELHSSVAEDGDSFQVTLRPNGVLTALHESHAPDSSGDVERKSLVVDGDEAEAIFELASAAVGEKALKLACTGGDSGRSASLVVTVAGKEVRSDCSNAAGWPPPKSKAALLIERINALLPPSVQFH